MERISRKNKKETKYTSIGLLVVSSVDRPDGLAHSRKKGFAAIFRPTPVM